MKKLALLASMVAVVAAVSVGVASATDPPRVVAEATGFGCNVLDANGNFSFTTDSRSTLLYNGKEILHCIAQGAGNGTVVLYEGIACNLVFTGFSTDPNNYTRVSKSGLAQLWCYNKASDAAAPASGAAGAVS